MTDSNPPGIRALVINLRLVLVGILSKSLMKLIPRCDAHLNTDSKKKTRTTTTAAATTALTAKAPTAEKVRADYYDKTTASCLCDLSIFTVTVN